VARLAEVRENKRDTTWYKTMLTNVRDRVSFLLKEGGKWERLVRSNLQIRVFCDEQIAHHTNAMRRKPRDLTKLNQVIAKKAA
jgi:hypothetical protein